VGAEERITRQVTQGTDEMLRRASILGGSPKGFHGRKRNPGVKAVAWVGGAHETGSETTSMQPCRFLASEDLRVSVVERVDHLTLCSGRSSAETPKHQSCIDGA